MALNWTNKVNDVDYVNADDVNSLAAGIKANETEIAKKANSTDVYTKVDIDTKLNSKVDKVTGKMLSTNDFTNSDKAKLDKLNILVVNEINTDTTSYNLILTDNNEYYFESLAHLMSVNVTYPTGNFECYIHFDSMPNPFTMTFPTGTKYIGDVPTFSADEEWELSIKNGIVIAAKVVSA